MKPTRHGLVIGKFYPPTLGHHHLIRTAAAQTERLTVVVMAAATETVPLSARVEWLRAEHAADTRISITGIRCDAPMDLGDQTVWAAQVALMRAAVRTVTDQPVDTVFSSEHYGEELAARFDAGHVLVDPDRHAVPVSATQVRADLAAGWNHLAPATRAGLVTRVVLVGAESTGTTTISRLLADHYRARGGIWRHTQWVGEYGRDYTAIKWQRDRSTGPDLALEDLVWTADDFDAIAAEQTRRENAAAQVGSPLLVCDTDAFATTVWERRYLGSCARTRPCWAGGLPHRALYLVTDHAQVPWTDDGLREGDQAIRAAMTEWFMHALTRAGESWVLLTGSVRQRLALAIRTTDALLAHAAAFGPPAHRHALGPEHPGDGRSAMATSPDPVS